MIFQQHSHDISNYPIGFFHDTSACEVFASFAREPEALGKADARGQLPLHVGLAQWMDGEPSKLAWLVGETTGTFEPLCTKIC